MSYVPCFGPREVPGHILCTRGIAALPPETQICIWVEVTNFDAFTEDNDPHGEHDFGVFDMAGAKIFWKIDYYNDKSCSFGSEDPADPAHLSRADHHAGVGVLIGDGGDAGGGNVAGIVMVIGVVGVMMMIVIIVIDDIITTISMANSMSASSTTISVSNANDNRSPSTVPHAAEVRPSTLRRLPLTQPIRSLYR
jgi:hypothetical protein